MSDLLLRRDLLAGGLAIGFGTSVFQAGQEVKPQAIAEGGPLKPPSDRPISVAIAISKGTTWIDFVGPQAVFETWHYDEVAKAHKPRFEMFLVSEKVGPCDGLVADYTFETAPPAQIVVIPAQSGSPALLDWLRHVKDTADVTMSVCTGAMQLAKAGILDGRVATTHHDSIDKFKKSYPLVKWVRGMRFVEGQRISTGGGLTAGIDLALRVTERYFGRDWATQVANHLEYGGKGWMV